MITDLLNLLGGGFLNVSRAIYSVALGYSVLYMTYTYQGNMCREGAESKHIAPTHTLAAFLNIYIFMKICFVPSVLMVVFMDASHSTEGHYA